SQERVENSYEMAEALIGNFDSSKKAKVAISFCDGLHTNGELYLNAFHDYDKDLVVAGGLAGDNGEFIETIVFNEDGILTGGCVIALLYSDDLEVHTKANFGWENIGKKLTITKVKENRVYEIDGICAVDIYAKYLGSAVADDLPKAGVEFPLIILRDKLNIPRAVLGKNSDGSLNFVGNFKLGDIVTFGYGNISAVIESSSKSFNSVFKNPVESIFIYSCMARKALLGNSIDIELKALSNITSLSGFFTYGEFYSNCKTLNNELLNQTMTLLTLSESKNVKENVNSIEKYNHSKKSKTLQALSHLISQTTLELEEINSSLSVKVDDEVKKNRIKDQQILNQSRLAQMGEMMSMIAHQWRQPLSAISSTSASLELKAALNKLDNDIVNEHAKRISLYSQHLSETINDFRNFFKPVKEEVETNFTEIVNSVLKIVQVSLENKNIEVILDLKSEDRFKSYPNELKQVVLNLLKNAEDALLGNSTEKPLVKISTFREDENLILEVSDNGGGISQEIIEKIFDPYFSTRLEKNGTGLGLYMSKIIIEDHCHSKLIAFNRGDGAVFQIKTSVNSKGEL
ncbi:MAG: FIST N-terminal domain-containing protein, partial [Campylobacterota bacterium]|nr:FIST N-terminal domain-containing protein [Campylobacterota bacterium]